ncbi:MAG: hypothetical protein EAZ57_05530 [Cytophagales bacterium]|nr:MAG: hypothetical protein EAZ67_12895 [Cytophagales bacterium]TAF61003.1 MAG: hypothetical protein EAZ57_05530 [Cytophagales bacterium]
MTIYKSKCLELNFFEEHKLIEMVWQDATVRMTEAELKAECYNYLDKILNHKPQKVLADTRKLLFPIAPELQVWINTEILGPAFATGLRKAAFLISEDLFAQIAIEQIMEENDGAQFQTRYFDSREDAFDWAIL